MTAMELAWKLLTRMDRYYRRYQLPPIRAVRFESNLANPALILKIGKPSLSSSRSFLTQWQYLTVGSALEPTTSLRNGSKMPTLPELTRRKLPSA